MIYGSTAAAAVFILSIGVIVAWLFCRRRIDRKMAKKQRLSAKLSTMSIPIYAYNDPHMPIDPNYYHEYMASNMPGIPMFAPPHHSPPGPYMIERRMSDYYPATSTGPPFYVVPTCKRSESMASRISYGMKVNGDIIKKKPTPARRKPSSDSINTESSFDENNVMKPEFQHYIPYTETVEHDKNKAYSEA